jgi:hypothetical protein
LLSGRPVTCAALADVLDRLGSSNALARSEREQLAGGTCQVK